MTDCIFSFHSVTQRQHIHIEQHHILKLLYRFRPFSYLPTFRSVVHLFLQAFFNKAACTLISFSHFTTFPRMPFDN